MSGKLYLVDYKEDGWDKHRAIEGTSTGCLSDREIIQMIHFYIGKRNRISLVVEFSTDLSLYQFDHVCDTPEIFTIPHRILYADTEELARNREVVGV